MDEPISVITNVTLIGATLTLDGLHVDGPGATTVGSLETGMEPAPDGTWETAAPGDALTEHATSTEAKTAARPSERVWITLHLRA